MLNSVVLVEKQLNFSEAAAPLFSISTGMKEFICHYKPIK